MCARQASWRYGALHAATARPFSTRCATQSRAHLQHNVGVWYQGVRTVQAAAGNLGTCDAPQLPLNCPCCPCGASLCLPIEPPGPLDPP